MAFEFSCPICGAKVFAASSDPDMDFICDGCGATIGVPTDAREVREGPSAKGRGAPKRLISQPVTTDQNDLSPERQRRLANSLDAAASLVIAFGVAMLIACLIVWAKQEWSPFWIALGVGAVFECWLASLAFSWAAEMLRLIQESNRLLSK